ncbi:MULTISPECIES: hypothetical protein [unclassified Micromonospora]|uniref:hypothetical protein n=1 Tax=unclassified Micromonospora TaxID=2617518 RepID=UPI002FF22629
MTSDDATPGYTVGLTTRQWQIIDRTVDNEVSVEAENGDPRGVVDVGVQVRVAGWDQVAHWTPGVPGSGSWPSDGQVVSVTLSSDQWALVCSSLTRWAKVSEGLGEIERASASRAIRDLVVAQVREPDSMWGADRP